MMVPEVGVEPTCLAAHDFESCVYANSTTRAYPKKLCRVLAWAPFGAR